MNAVELFLKIIINHQKEKIKKIYNDFSVESKLTLANKIKIIFIQLIPIIITALIAIIGLGEVDLYKIKWWCIFFLAATLVVFSGINIWYDLVNNEVIDDLYTLQKKEMFYTKIIEYFKNVSISIFKDTALVEQLKWVIGTFNDFLKQNETKRKENLRATIKSLIFQLKDTLDFTNDTGEMISIAVYLFDDDKQELVDYFSKKSSLMNKGPKGRNWSINSESHLAHTYRSGEGRVIYDIKDFYPGIDNPQDDDDVFYRSSVTHPLTYFDTQNTVRGVFCVTSNQPGAFCLKDNYYSEDKEDIRRLLFIKSTSIIIIGMVINLLLAITHPNGNDFLVKNELNDNNLNLPSNKV